MLRSIGAGFIILSFALFGAARAGDLRRRARLVAALASAVELLRGEIVSRLAPLPEAAARLAGSGPRETRGFFACLAAALDGLGERDFAAIWDGCLRGLALREPEREALAALGRSLGRYGVEEQDAALARCLSGLGAAAEAARREAAAGGRLCAGLSLSAGALLAIVLY